MAASSDSGMDEVFKALADTSRRRLLDGLNDRSGQTLRELCAGLDMARQSVSKHLAVLETAGLVTTLWRGREKLHYLDAAPIDAIRERWISRYSRERVRAVADLKTALEQQRMSNTEFAYTTYIKTTPEELWQAQYGVTIADPAQVVLEADPYRRLAYSFHTFTPEFVESVGLDDDFLAKVSSERRSKVSFDIEPHGEQVKLTLVHDDFDPESAVLLLVSQGWPELLSNLKTLLETGEAPRLKAVARR
jgi:DNA-binding transcriptional ArsR family regulator/uncharacterized protein YndB with AHSA1/START domain